MPSSTVNICVLTLVLLSFQQICFSRPHSRTERGLVKDYFVPDLLALSSDNFERADDGKFYLKKSAHKSDSEVKYTSAEKAEGGNNVDQGGAKTNDAEIAKSESETIQIERTEPVKGNVGETPILEVVSNAPIVEEMKVVKQLSLPKTESVIEEAGKDIEVTEKAPITPIVSDFTVPPKPDSKDEIPLKKTELPPLDLDEKVEDKVSIGQFPDLYHRLVPVPGNFRIPILIPVRHISYKAVKVMPLPPADVSDRLPLPYEDDIVGEGAHESESEVVSEPIAEEKKDDDPHIGNPLVMGVHFPLLSFRNFLNNLKETDKKDVEKESKVVDVLGKKFLMQSNVMKYPSSDNGQTYLRFLSIKPLEEVKPLEPKDDVAAEEAVDKIPEVVAIQKEKSGEEDIEKKEKDLIESEIKKEKEIEKEAEILKAEETEIKMKVEQDVPKDVILKNMGEPEMTKKTEEDEEEMTSASEETGTPVAEKKGTEKGDEEEMQMKADEKKMTTVDALLKTEHSVKDMEIASKKEFFLTEKKKEKTLEKSEEIKPKKSEKKKKKCKCEEKDSDSDDDSDE